MAWLRLLALLAVLAPATARAADSTVSAMTAAGALTGAELLYCVQGGADRKCTVTQVIDVAVTTYGTSLYYTPIGITTNGTAADPPNDTIMCAKGIVERKLTTTNGAIRVGTAQAAVNGQVAIYTDSSGRPGDLIRATGNISLATGSTAVAAAWSSTAQIGPGGSAGGAVLWWCYNGDSTTATLTSLRVGSVSPATALMGATLQNVLTATSSIGSLHCAGANCNGGSSTFGTWPSSLAGTTWSEVVTATMPAIMFDVTSVP